MTALLPIIYRTSSGFSHLFQCCDLPPARAFPYVDNGWPLVAGGGWCRPGPCQGWGSGQPRPNCCVRPGLCVTAAGVKGEGSLLEGPGPSPRRDGAPGVRGKPVVSLLSPACGLGCSRVASGLDGAAAPGGKGRGRGGLTGSGVAELLLLPAGVSAPPRLTLAPVGVRRPGYGPTRGSRSPAGTHAQTHTAPHGDPQARS